MKEILEKLRSAELKSNEIIVKAKKDASLMIEKENESYNKEISSLKQKLEKQRLEKIKKAQDELTEESEKIIKESKIQVLSFKKKSSVKKDKAISLVIKEILN
jgi:vacuolar-type H+-ATPase subunit H